MNWTIDHYNQAEMHGHAIKRHILSKQTKYQYVEVVDTFNYGRALLLDGFPQSSIADEFIYHETIVHPALCAHPEPKNVLIIGGGEGAVLREVLKHSPVQQVTMVDIDGELVDICRAHLQDWHQGAFDDPRVQLLYMDGREYLQNSPDSFDCIILDLSDPFDGSPASRLFTIEFYQLVQRSLREGGVVSLQAESGAMKHNGEHLRIIHTLKQVFPSVLPCYTFLPIYATLFGFAVCGDANLIFEQVTSDQVDVVLQCRGVRNLRFYNGQTARSLFALPPYMRQQIDSLEDQLISDSDPLSIDV